jgi:hypothetical protein
MKKVNFLGLEQGELVQKQGYAFACSRGHRYFIEVVEFKSGPPVGLFIFEATTGLLFDSVYFGKMISVKRMVEECNECVTFNKREYHDFIKNAKRKFSERGMNVVMPVNS